MRLLGLAIILISTSISLGVQAQVQTTAVPSRSLEGWSEQPTALPSSVFDKLSGFHEPDSTNTNPSPMPDANGRSPQSIDHLVFGATPPDVKQTVSHYLERRRPPETQMPSFGWEQHTNWASEPTKIPPVRLSIISRQPARTTRHPNTRLGELISLASAPTRIFRSRLPGLSPLTLPPVSIQF